MDYHATIRSYGRVYRSFGTAFGPTGSLTARFTEEHIRDHVRAMLRERQADPTRSIWVESLDGQQAMIDRIVGEELIR